ncbi:NAD-dependent epimerase/dehydratase family protein [bacterium]|nr:NAD-dependent epimerase/dehydratase family protein [candidate division CSSED10-310 bacterium]
MGRFAVRELLEHGHEVTVFNRGRTGYPLPAEAQWIEGDRFQITAQRTLLRALRPDVVVDMMAIGGEDTSAVMDVFRDRAPRMVTIGSQDVYLAYGVCVGIEDAHIQSVPVTEFSSLRTRHYMYKGRADGMETYEKIMVERVVLADPAIRGTILRMPMVYGPGDYQHRFYQYIKPMADGREVLLIGAELADWRSSYGYVEDMAHAIVLAVENEKSAGRIYNVGIRHSIEVLRLVRELGRLMRFTGRIVQVPRNVAEFKPHGLNVDQHLDVDSSLIRMELGYSEPTTWEEGLRRTIEWELANPPPVDIAQTYAKEDELMERLRLLG